MFGFDRRVLESESWNQLVKTTRSFLIMLATLVVVGTGTMYAAPSVCVDAWIQVERRLARLEVVSQSPFATSPAHLRGGIRGAETMVLLHGFGGTKDNWLRFARHFTALYDVLVPDLPGFGDSAIERPQAYRASAQAIGVLAWLDAEGVGEFHLAGNSMGGHIAMEMALAAPERIRSLALIGGPGGIETPTWSEARALTERGEIPLIPNDLRSYEYNLDLSFVERPYLPRPLFEEFARRALNRVDQTEVAWHMYASEPYIEPARLRELAPPSLLLWGLHERHVHEEAIATLQATCPHLTVHYIPQSAHLPMVEQPAETARLYKAFVESSTNN